MVITIIIKKEDYNKKNNKKHKDKELQKMQRLLSEQRGHAGRLHGKGKARRSNKATGGKLAR